MYRIGFSIERVSGEIVAPPSKSFMQRLVAGALLADGESLIMNPSLSDDGLSSLRIAEAMGADVSEHPDGVVIKGGSGFRTGRIECGESGLAIRLFSAIAALREEEVTITGSGTLTDRPMDMVENALRAFGAEVNSNKGYLPVVIRGPLTGGVATVDGSMSSQQISGLLFALPVLPVKSILRVDSPSSRPYIDITLDILKEFGVEVVNNNYVEFVIEGGQRFKPVVSSVEGDWSGAAFFLVMGAVGGSVTVRGLNPESVQGDRAILDALREAGAEVVWESNDAVRVARRDLVPFKFDISGTPDLAPPLILLASACRGKSVLYGTGRLKIKESDRGSNLRDNFGLFNVEIETFDDHIEITGGTAYRDFTGVVSSFSDHRMAMAMAGASLLTTTPVIVDNIACIDKSYPAFTKHFKMAGGTVFSGDGS